MSHSPRVLADGLVPVDAYVGWPALPATRHGPGFGHGYALHMSDAEVREAVDKIVDRERLLEGEDPDTTNRADAVHWLWVYAELLGFKRDITNEAQSAGVGKSNIFRLVNRGPRTI